MAPGREASRHQGRVARSPCGKGRLPPGAGGQRQTRRLRGQRHVAPRRGRGRGKAAGQRARPAVSFGHVLAAWEHPSLNGTRAGLTARHTMRTRTQQTAGVWTARGSGLQGQRFRSGKAGGLTLCPGIPATSLQLLPVVGQVAFALAPDADQSPGRPEAPAGGACGTGQAAVPRGALDALLPAWPERTVAHGVA